MLNHTVRHISETCCLSPVARSPPDKSHRQNKKWDIGDCLRGLLVIKVYEFFKILKKKFKVINFKKNLIIFISRINN